MLLLLQHEKSQFQFLIRQCASRRISSENVTDFQYITMLILKLKSSDEAIKPYCQFWKLIHSYSENALVLKLSYLSLGSDNLQS